jgi:hypothetical protein
MLDNCIIDCPASTSISSYPRYILVHARAFIWGRRNPLGST